MSERLTIEKITLAGFRAYLSEQTLSLMQGRTVKSLAIFAPNAKGKSSLVDALEFFFSSDGTVQRLGQRRSTMQGGREALVHVKAAEAGVEPAVTVSFRHKNSVLSARRVVADTALTVPDAAKAVLASRQVEFIIRGADLRYFVEKQSPSERYAEVSAWFGLSSLVDIQNNLRALRLAIKQKLDADAATKERLADLADLTDNGVTTSAESDVVRWINDHLLKDLDPTLRFHSLDDADVAYREVQARRDAEEREAGVAQLAQAVAALQNVYSHGDGDTAGTGAVVAMELAAEELRAATAAEADEREKSAGSLFRDVWEAAQKVLGDPAVPLQACPVCDTAFDATRAGSRESLHLHVTTRVDALRSYRLATDALVAAKQNLTQRISSAQHLLASLTTAFHAIQRELPAEIGDYSRALAEWRSGDSIPAGSDIKLSIKRLTEEIECAKESKQLSVGQRTWTTTLAKLDRIITTTGQLRRAIGVRNQLQQIHESLEAIERFIAGRTRTYCQTVIDALRERTNSIFRSVHPDSTQAPEIKLELDPEGKRPELNLAFDFAPNRRGVPPGGYLSDGQIHTLALSLRLAAIEMFNASVPIIVLDDVVTSYDSEHRRALAGLLASAFCSHQIIVLTHDERFFLYLKEQMPSSSWDFKRITALDPQYGPRFHEHNVADELIGALHAAGRSAANEMRQAEEEWLTRICRDFGTEVRIRDVHRAHNYERSELATSLMAFLKSRSLVPPAVPGVANRFLTTLQSGQIENFGSHFQDNPDGLGSTGDEITRWKEFTAFRDAFRCRTCGGRRFKRPFGLKSPVCQKDACETAFAFARASGEAVAR